MYFLRVLSPRCLRSGLASIKAPVFDCRWPSSPLSSHGHSMCICVLISSSKETRQIGIGSTSMTSLNLSYLFKDPMSKHILEYWVLYLQYLNIGIILPIILPFRGKRTIEPAWEHLGSRVKMINFPGSFLRSRIINVDLLGMGGVARISHTIELDPLEKVTRANDIVIG